MDFLKRNVAGYPVGVWLFVGVAGIGLGILMRRRFGDGGGGGGGGDTAGFDPASGGGAVVIRSELPNEGALVAAVGAELQPEFSGLNSQLEAQLQRIAALEAAQVNAALEAPQVKATGITTAGGVNTGSTFTVNGTQISGALVDALINSGAGVPKVIGTTAPMPIYKDGVQVTPISLV